MSERKLASIRKILNIEPIENADAIELVTVDGWKVVVAKNVGHQIGDLVVYCEVDSFLPIREEFEFLRKSSYKKMDDLEGFRLKTIRLRGQLSQGLILPLSGLPEMKKQFAEGIGYFWDIGEDVSELLGIIKYEAPIPAELAGKMKGGFPSFIPKTDEERIQNLTSEYETYKTNNDLYYITEKLDGSSATFYLNDGEFGVCSRNIDLLETEGNTFWKVARELDLENKMKSLPFNVALQGELIGEGVQGNPYKLKGQTVRFFNMFDIDQQRRVNIGYFIIKIEELGLDLVPLIESSITLPDTIDELILMADGKSELNPNFDREGIVIRSYDGKISFKVISNKFLLNEK